MIMTIDNYKEFVGKVVEFKNMETTECDYDDKMRSRIVEICIKHDDIFCIYSDFSEFEEYNKKFMKANYFDKNGNPTLTWDKTLFYPKSKISMDYFDTNDTNYFTIIEEN